MLSQCNDAKIVKTSPLCRRCPVLITSLIKLGLAVVVLGVPIGLFIANAKRLEAEPALDAEPRSVDIGVVPAGEALQTSVRLVNPSPVSFDVLRVSAGCSCTTPDWSGERTILPGDALEVPVTVRVPLEGDTVYADVRFYYRRTDLPDTATYSIMVQFAGSIIHDYRLSDTVIEFGEFHERLPARKTMYLEGDGLAEVAVRRVACTHEAVVASAQQVATNPNRWRIDVQLRSAPRLGPGYWEAHVVIETNSKRARQARVRLRGSITALPLRRCVNTIRRRACACAGVLPAGPQIEETEDEYETAFSICDGIAYGHGRRGASKCIVWRGMHCRFRLHDLQLQPPDLCDRLLSRPACKRPVQ